MVPIAVVYFSFVFLPPLHILAKRIGGSQKAESNIRNYNISITALYFDNVNPQYFGPGTMIQLHNPNEYSFRFNILQTLPSDAKMIAYSYEKNNRGQYVPSITTREAFCDEFQKEQQGEPIYKCLHYRPAGIKECPFKKGVYYGDHTRCTAVDCPAIIPGHYWRINKTWITKDNDVLLDIIIDVTITRKSLALFPPKKPTI